MFVRRLFVSYHRTYSASALVNAVLYRDFLSWSLFAHAMCIEAVKHFACCKHFIYCVEIQSGMSAGMKMARSARKMCAHKKRKKSVRLLQMFLLSECRVSLDDNGMTETQESTEHSFN